MRNLIKKLTCLVLTLVMCVSFFGGCNLVSVDTERDLNQVIAEIQITDDSPVEKVYKKDIIMAYINYGYYYEQQGAAMGQIVESIVSQLINNRVYVQNAVNKFDTEFNNEESSYKVVYDEIKAEYEERKAAGENPIDKWNSLDKWDLERYLTDPEILDAKYHTYKDMNDLVDAYISDKPGDKVQDTLIEEVRTAPTGAANAEKELDDTAKSEYIEKGIEKNSRKKAYNDVIKILKANDLLGSEYKGTIESSQYFAQTLKNYQENKIIEKFEKCIKDAARETVGYDDVEAAYTKKYNEQLALDETAFASLLSSATSDEPVLVGRGDGHYGYVYNLLLGPGDDVLAEANKFDNNMSNVDKQASRESVLNDKTIVKDLRSTWILSGYDFDGTNFTGDYAVAGENSLAFQGVAKALNEDDGSEDFKTEYGIESMIEFSLEDFIEKMIIGYLYKDVSNNSEKFQVLEDDSDYVYKHFKVNGVENYHEKVNELLFAFSTDPGSLNTYKGYTKEGSYVEEFKKGVQELFEEGGENSCVVVATEYGYHVIFYSEVFDSSYDHATLTDYLNKFEGDKNWEEEFKVMVATFADYENTDSYLYKLFNSISTSIADKALSDEQGRILDYVFGDNDCVVKYEDRYADLLGK